MKTALHTCAPIFLTIGTRIADDRRAEPANAETIAALESDDATVRAAELR